MKLKFMDKEIEYNLEDKKINDNILLVCNGKLLKGVEFCYLNDELEALTVADLDKIAKLISISDKMDGYHDLLKADKIEALKQ